jgi:hypothetical protein
LFPHNLYTITIPSPSWKDPELLTIKTFTKLETDFGCLFLDVTFGCLQECLLFLEAKHAGDDGGRELLCFIIVLQHLVVVSLAGETDLVFG